MAESDTTERRKPNGEALRKEGKRWIERIEEAGKLEKTWIDDAEKAVAAYTGERIAGSEATRYDFNVLFSNVETIVPAIINSPPQPDIRRRFADDDPVAKDGSELLERTIRIQVDDSRLQIEMEGAAHDAFLAGRGSVRLRFKADVDGETTRSELHDLAEDYIEERGGESEDDEGPEVEERVYNERFSFEAVSWRDYRHGPAKRWEDRPWDAFRHSIPMEDIEAFADHAITSAQTLPEDKIEKGETDNDVVVWEVWCKKSRKVRFVEETTGKILKIVDDPLGLSKFFPICTPMQPIEVTGRLMPVNPFAIYRKLADELDTTTRRINTITHQMRVRGWYSGDATELANMLDADDTDFVPIANPELWAQNGGIANAVAFWPIEKFILALRELYNNREATKQAIYEITGISDIVRGASQGGVKSATEQQIKSQWGSLRIQKMQRMMERAARELFVMMAEIIPSKFSAETLEAMTGIRLIPKPQELQPIPPPPQPPQGQELPPEVQQQAQQAQAQWQQMEQERQKKLAHMQALTDLINDDMTRMYRIDVESDSTVRADLTQKKQEQAEFLQGTAAYFSAAGPAVQSGIITQEGAIEIYAATARLFTLGKSTEDALENEITKAREASKQPKPDPEGEKLKAEQEAKQADLELRKQELQANMLLEAKKLEADLQDRELERQGKTQEAQAKLGLINAQMQRDAQKGDLEMSKLALEIEAKREELQIKRQTAQIDVAAKVQQANVSLRSAEQQSEIKAQQADQAMRLAEQKAKQKDKTNGS